MKLLSWNIQQGGGKRLDRIEDAIRRHDPDVIVLGEYMPNASRPLIDRLASTWPHRVLTEPPPRRGGLAVVSRIELQPMPVPTGPGEFPYRYLPVRLVPLGINVIGVYGPLHQEPYDAYWEGVLGDLAKLAATPSLVVGDFNTGASLIDAPDRAFFCSAHFSRLPTVGYRDLWRERSGPDHQEFTWYGRVNGFRLDHAFGTQNLAERVRDCRYDHAVREEQISDHSALVVELRQ